MIRIVWGTGVAGTRKASFDSALADANLHTYNLRSLSSVIPADVPVRLTDTAPDLGPTGNAVDAVIARQTSPPGTRAAAGIAWVRDTDDTGIIYEAEDHDPETVRELLERGIEHGCAIREIEEPAPETKVVTAEPASEQYTTALVVAVYGESESLF